jgi:hypothetical protein
LLCGMVGLSLVLEFTWAVWQAMLELNSIYLSTEWYRKFYSSLLCTGFVLGCILMADLVFVLILGAIIIQDNERNEFVS